MKGLILFLALILNVAVFAQGNTSGTGNNLNTTEVDCYERMSKVSCASEPYIGGHSSGMKATCRVSLRLRMLDGTREAHVIEGVNYKPIGVSPLDQLGEIVTLGITASARNAAAASAAKADAKFEVESKADQFFECN